LGLEPATTSTAATATANTYSAAASIISDAGATACNSVVGDLPGMQPLSPYSGYETGFDRSPSMASRTRTINSAAADAAVVAAVAAVPVPLVTLPLSVTGLTVTGPVTVSGSSGKRGSVAKLQRIPSAVQQHVQALPAVTPADVAATAAAAAAAASRHASTGGAAAAKRAATDDAAAAITIAAAALVAQSRTAHLTSSSPLKKQGTAAAASTTATADIVSSAAAAVQGLLSKLSVDTSRAGGSSSRRSSFNSTTGSLISSANSSPVGSRPVSLRRTFSNRYSTKNNSEDNSFRHTDKFADSNSSSDLHNSSSSRKVSTISSGLKRSTLADIDKLCITSKPVLGSVVTDSAARSSDLDSEIDALLLEVADSNSNRTPATAAAAAAAVSGAVTAATAANATTTAASTTASASAAAGGAQVAVATRWIRQHVPDMVAMIPLLEMVMSCGFADTVATAVLDPETKHRRLDRLVIEIMKAASASGPLLVVAENTQWMDMQSMKLMHKVSIYTYIDIYISLLYCTVWYHHY
jgi:trimeric autotransporter adhesin